MYVRYSNVLIKNTLCQNIHLSKYDVSRRNQLINSSKMYYISKNSLFIPNDFSLYNTYFVEIGYDNQKSFNNE